MHADQFCCPESHLGNWPMPPPNAILAPHFLTPCQVAKLASHRTLRREHLRPRTTSRSESDETGVESGVIGKSKKVKKYVKRQAKKPAGSAETSDDEDEKSPKQRRQRRVLIFCTFSIVLFRRESK